MKRRVLSSTAGSLGILVAAKGATRETEAGSRQKLILTGH